MKVEIYKIVAGQGVSNLPTALIFQTVSACVSQCSHFLYLALQNRPAEERLKLNKQTQTQQGEFTKSAHKYIAAVMVGS